MNTVCPNLVVSQEDLVVIPGACFHEGRIRAPYGCMASSNFVHHEQIEKEETHLDYALIVLPNNFTNVVNHWPWLQPRVDEYTMHIKTVLGIPGFPTDKPLATAWMGKATMQTAPLALGVLAYTISTCGGQSGSPVWLEMEKRPDKGEYGHLRVNNSDLPTLIVGIHANSVGFPESGSTGCHQQTEESFNRGPRVTCEMIDYIVNKTTEMALLRPSIDRGYFKKWCTRTPRLFGGSNGQRP